MDTGGQRQYCLRVPARLLDGPWRRCEFPLVSLLVLKGIIKEFDVDVDFQAEAIPTLLTTLRAT